MAVAKDKSLSVIKKKKNGARKANEGRGQNGRVRENF